MTMALEDFTYVMKSDHYPNADLYNLVFFTKDYKHKVKVPFNKEGFEHWMTTLTPVSPVSVLNSFSDRSKKTGIHATELDYSTLSEER